MRPWDDGDSGAACGCQPGGRQAAAAAEPDAGRALPGLGPGAAVMQDHTLEESATPLWPAHSCGTGARAPRAGGPRSPRGLASCWLPFRPSMCRHRAELWLHLHVVSPSASGTFDKDTSRWINGRPTGPPLTDDVCTDPVPKQPRSEVPGVRGRHMNIGDTT